MLKSANKKPEMDGEQQRQKLRHLPQRPPLLSSLNFNLSFPTLLPPPSTLKWHRGGGEQGVGVSL